MDNINYDYELEKHYHPENFERDQDVVIDETKAKKKKNGKVDTKMKEIIL
jgi:hypothetical protein